MTTTTAPSIEFVLDLAHKLPRTEQAELIARLARDLVLPSTVTTRSPEDVRAAWSQLRAELSARPAGTTSMAAQLDLDRDQRDRTLRGQDPDGNVDVHP